MAQLEPIIKHLRWKSFAKVVKNGYPNCFGDQYSLLLGTQTLVLFFQFYVNKKYAKVAINDFKRTYKTKMQIEEKNNVTKRPSSKRRNCLQKHFHSFNRLFQEEKRFCIWHELRNKTQLGIYVHWTPQWVQHNVHCGTNLSPKKHYPPPFFFFCLALS